MRRLASSDLFFRYVEEVSGLSAARIRRCQKFELEKSSPSPLIGTISTSRRVSALPDLEWFLSHIRSGRRADVTGGLCRSTSVPSQGPATFLGQVKRLADFRSQ